MDTSRYPSTVAELLREPRLAPLDGGQPNRAVRAQLEALGDEQAWAPQRVRDRDMALACRAGLWLYHDFLDEAHTIAQDLKSPEGSYWHALMHRRELDFANSKYWFRRVGTHPIFMPLRQAAVELACTAGSTLNIPEPWDPYWFVDLCEACWSGRDPGVMLARQIQQMEWELLFDHCYQKAAPDT